MSSQEDYLDQLLRNIMNGGKGQQQPEAETEEMNADAAAEEATKTVGEMTDMPEEPETSGIYGMPDIAEMGDMSVMPGTSGTDEILGMPEMYNMPEVPGLSELPEASEMYGTPDVTEMGDASMMPEASGMYGTPDVTEMGDVSMMPEASGMYGTPDVTEMGDVSMMPEIFGMDEVSEVSDDVAVMPEMLEIPEDSGLSELPETSGMYGVPDATEMGDMLGMPEVSGMPDPVGMPDETVITPELNEVPEVSELSDRLGISAMDEVLGMSELSEPLGDFEDDNVVLGTPVEDTDLEALLKRFEDTDTTSEENESDPSEGNDISSMSEEDIDKLLADSKGTPEDNKNSMEEAFQGDVVDLLKGTEDSELQEIQDLLEKSDNNEAVGDEIEDLLRGAVQDRYQNASGESGAGTAAEDTDGAEEQLPSRQQKAMDKKRIKEEKAAARKAEREARRAEKAARKAARKAGKEGGTQDTENTSVLAGDGTAMETEAAVDTAFLDSILSEAGKIDGAETISSATGNYDAKVDDIISDEGEDISTEKKEGLSSSAGDALGIDLDNLFGGSAEAESAMMAGGDSDLAGFVALDGDDMAGIIELGGEDEEESKPKKKGFFSRFMEFLTEEDEEEEEENENIKLSEENQEIIEDLDREKAKKDKKGKKGKKKVKKGDASTEDGEDSGDGEESKAGKKKAKKPKKEKLPKEKEPVDPRNRLSLKKVLPVMLICLSLGAAIIIIAFAFVDFSGNKAARDAYYAGDYQTCYQYLYGKDMNETEQIMYGRSESILTIRMWIREYEMLAAEGTELEALDSLIQSVNDYPVLYEYAGRWNAAGEVAQEYATILNLLYENYGLTEDQARAIAAEKDDIEYTRQVNAIVQGGAYGSWNEPEPVVDVPLQDELPEETELPENNFIDTNPSVQ